MECTDRVISSNSTPHIPLSSIDTVRPSLAIIPHSPAVGSHPTWSCVVGPSSVLVLVTHLLLLLLSLFPLLCLPSCWVDMILITATVTTMRLHIISFLLVRESRPSTSRTEHVVSRHIQGHHPWQSQKINEALKTLRTLKI